MWGDLKVADAPNQAPWGNSWGCAESPGVGKRVILTRVLLVTCGFDSRLGHSNNHGVVAQLGERWPCKPEVVGSNPISSTMEGADYWKVSQS